MNKEELALLTDADVEEGVGKTPVKYLMLAELRAIKEELVKLNAKP